jgi:Flp pilus assembly protein TadG
MRLGRRGTTALEFALVAPALMLLLFGCIEFARLLWTQQALQLAGDQTARCVAISGTACATPSTYAISTAAGFGAIGLVASGVVIANQPPAITNAAACNPPTGNTAVQVKLSLPFSSPAALLIPALGQTLVTTSCYPLTGH